MERDKTPRLQRNLQPTSEMLRRSHQNVPSATGVDASQFSNQSITARNHDSHMHESAVPYGPYQYNGPMQNHHYPTSDFAQNVNYPPLVPSFDSMNQNHHAQSQSRGSSSMAVHNNQNYPVHGTNTSFPSEPPTWFSHGSISHIGSLETRDMYRMRYPEFEMYNSSDSRAPPSTNDYQLHLNQLPLAMQETTGNNLNPQPQMPSPSAYSHRTNPPQQDRPSWDSTGDGNRPIPIYEIHDGVLIVDGFTHPNVPNLQVDTGERTTYTFANYEAYAAFVETAIEMNQFYDHMSVVQLRQQELLDAEDTFVPYEELVDLGEGMGHVNPGFPEEEILKHLKIRTHVSPSNLNEAQSLEEEREICVVCQGEYENDNKIGTLQCGHEYHVDCIKKWLRGKNVCPICKATAFTIKS